MSRLYRCAHRALVLITVAALLLAAQSPAQAQGPVRIIWLHHSVGLGIIDGGNVRGGLDALGYEFYDHGYNEEGLRLADGSSAGTNFDVPDDNTYPDGLSVVFSQDLHSPPDNTFSYLMQYNVIMVKSCFPTSNIINDEQLEVDKGYYQMIARRTDTYPDKVFIIVTHPPQVPESTNADEARRARALNDWLLSDEFRGGHANLFVFDLFGRLAGSDNLLRAEYRVSDSDGHPSDIANAAIGPELVDFVDQAIRSAWGDSPPPSGGEPQAADQPPAATVEQPPAGQPAAISALDDFEAGAGAWHGETDRPESVIECGADSAFAHGGKASLRIHYDIAPGGWINCSRTFDALQDWSGATGLSFWLMADTPDQWITLAVYSGEADAPQPFEVFFPVPEASLDAWSQVSFAWSDFKLADWADASGLQEIDPGRVTGYNFSLGAGEVPNQGIVWIDDVELVGGSAPAALVEETQESEADQPEPAAPESQPQRQLCGGAGAVLLLPLAAGMVIAGRRRRQSHCI
jgi:hypothetical protein